MDLKVRSASYYGNTFPLYNLPLEIGCYSTDSERKYHNDDHQLKYLVLPDRLENLCLDLNAGYSDFVPAYSGIEYKNKVLKWIISHEEQVRKYFPDLGSPDSKIDFVCSRGILTMISSTIYETSDDWMLYATKFRSVIYLRKVKTERKVQGEKDAGDKGKRMTSWGFKFEQYMTSGTMNSDPITSVPVNENEKYYVVEKVKLDNHRILMRAEVDAVDPEHFKEARHDPTSIIRYVELKTSKIITHDRQIYNFLRYKLLKWYLQSYFAGILKVICGYRDDDGILRKLRILNVKDMPDRAKGLWSPAPCLKFCSHFLNYVKKCVVKDDPKVVYRFHWKPRSDITCEELSEESPVLPDWYIENVNVI